jgi:hypothetical protein
MATTFAARAAQEVNTTTAGDQTSPTLTMLANGGHMVAWNSNGNVVAQAFDASGNKTGPEMTLFTGYTLGGIAALADGSLAVSASRSWGDTSGPHSDLWYERIDASGHLLAAPTLVDGTGGYDVWVSGGAVYAMPGGGFGITDVHTTRPTPLQSIDRTVHVYDSSGASTGASVPTASDFLQESAQLPSGGFVVEGNTSEGPTPVQSAMWRTVDSQGNTIASVALTGHYGVDGYGEGGAVTLADGRALAVWDHLVYGQNGAATSTWQAQWIDASGHPTGTSFNLGLASNYDPHFTALADGSFIATWVQQPNYGAPYELYAQHFDASAHADSGAVHLATVGNGTAPFDNLYSVTATADGGFLVDFQRTGDGQDVWEQKFDVTSAPDTPATSTTHYPGIDEVTYAGAHTSYTVTHDAQGFEITGPSGTESLAGIERVRFGDGYGVALDITGDAGQAYRLYQAAFDRAPDLQGLGFQTNDLDMGYSLAHVAQNFIDSPEFQSKYGPGLTDTEFITLLYQHVLHRDPEADGLQYHLNEFAQGDTRADMLTHFSESPENQANVIGTIGNGMLFIPYV